MHVAAALLNWLGSIELGSLSPSLKTSRGKLAPVKISFCEDNIKAQ